VWFHLLADAESKHYVAFDEPLAGSRGTRLGVAEHLSNL
jgi:hypothetical protein